MNATDLRIAYKMDTGYYPLWAENHDGRDIWGTQTFVKGYPCSRYGLWLEDQTKSGRELRNTFYRKFNEIPTSNYFAPGMREVFYKEYIEWLEGIITWEKNAHNK